MFADNGCRVYGCGFTIHVYVIGVVEGTQEAARVS